MLSVLDTSILISERTAPIHGEIAISVVSIAELQFGVLVAPDDERRAHRLARLSAILRSFEPLLVDGAVAASYGALAAATHRAGRKNRARSLDLAPSRLGCVRVKHEAAAFPRMRDGAPCHAHPAAQQA